MRTDIYYWKCDNPLTEQEKLAYNDKYRLADISDTVRAIALDHFKREPVSVEATGSAGNHYTYLIKLPDRTVFFRADDGKLDDDYMIAEETAMSMVRQRGIPVPEVYATDVSKAKYPFRFQLLKMMPGQNLNKYYRDGTLDRTSVSRQVGRYLAQMHRIQADGFGFFNTDTLRRENRVVGLDMTNSGYFHKKLDHHLKYLQDKQFLAGEEIREIEGLIRRNEYLLQLSRGSLVHKDMAFWNLLGTPVKITAVVDWDDVIVGDPVDDLAILRCFYNQDVFQQVLRGYQEVSPLPENFQPKLWLYLVRNMLWKAVIRIFMKYFEMSDDFFLLNNENRKNLRQFTHDRLFLGVNELKKM